MKPSNAAALALVGWYLLTSSLLWAKTFIAPDGAFTFSYSNQLTRCEKDPHGDIWNPPHICSAYHPTCDELVNFGEGQTSVVCFAYPRNKFTDTQAFEAATFSVEVVDDSNTAKSCLAGPEDQDVDKDGTKRIHGVLFTAFGLTSAGANQGVGYEFYRAFHNGKCYQLGINQASANAQIFEPPAREPDWKEVGRTLEQALKSFRFLK